MLLNKYLIVRNFHFLNDVHICTCVNNSRTSYDVTSFKWRSEFMCTGSQNSDEFLSFVNSYICIYFEASSILNII